MTAIENVYAARDKDRATGLSFIQNIFTGFTELHGDRRFGDDPAVVGGIAWLKDIAVTVIAIEKGADTKSRVMRNFGCVHPEGYRKAMRLMQQAEKFHRPVVCFVDTSGAYCGVEAEERGQGEAIASNLVGMMGLKTPIISVLIGEGGSGGALALAVANQVWMLERAVYSVISPEGCASILYKDASRAAEAAENLRLTAHDLLELGVVEKVISEARPSSIYRAVQRELLAELPELCALSGEEVARRRFEKFRAIGVPQQARR